MYPTHLLPPTLRRAAQLLALDFCGFDARPPRCRPAIDALDAEIGELLCGLDADGAGNQGNLPPVDRRKHN